jgi:hypothetical protein
MRSWFPFCLFSGAFRRAAAACFAFAMMPFPAFPLQVYLTVTDKLDRPIADASVCPQEDDSHCAKTDGQGKAAFSPATRIPDVTQGRSGSAITLRGGRLSIFAAEAGPARIAFFDSRGRAIRAAFERKLPAGNNAIELPESKEGLVFFRVSAPGLKAAGKAILLSGSRGRSGGETRAERPGSAPGVAALGKAAAANLHPLIVSKTGYRTYTYRPKAEVDTGVVIRMAEVEDSGLGYTRLLKAAVTEIDSANRILRYSYAENSCSGDKPVTGTHASSLPFRISEEKWYFPAGNCQGVALGKSGSGIYGTWKTLGVEDLPTGLLPNACDPAKDSLNTSTVNLFFLNEGGGWDIDLRQDSIVIGLNRVACPGSQIVNDISHFDGKDGRPLLVSNSCREVKLRNAAGDTGTYAFRVGNDSLRGTFTYKSDSCPTPAVAALADLNAPKTCPETQAASIALDSAFQACVKSTGFLP